MVEVTVSWSAYQGGKPYVARLLGRDAKFGFEREFIRRIERTQSRSGQTGSDDFVLDEPGIYESQGRKGRRYFEVTENGERVDLSDATAAAKRLDGEE